MFVTRANVNTENIRSNLHCRILAAKRCIPLLPWTFLRLKNRNVLEQVNIKVHV